MIELLRVDTTFSGGDGLPGYNSLYFGGSTSGQAVVAEQAAWNAWAAAASAIHTSVTITTSSEVFVVDPLTGQITGSFAATGHSGAGTAAGERLPQATQGLVQATTNLFLAGRRLRGRIFVPAPVDAANNDGAPDISYRNDVDAAFTQLMSDAGGAGGWVIYSRTHGQAANVSQVNVWQEWAVQRSRRA